MENEGIPKKFQKIATDLGYTSGKLQTALKRLKKNGKIIMKKVSSEDGKRFVTKVFINDFESDIIIPIRMDEITAKIIEMVPVVSDKFESLDDLFKKALVNYFQEKIDNGIKRKAIKEGVAKGLISKELEAKLNA